MKKRYFVQSVLMIGAAALLGCQVSPSTLNLGLQNGSLRIAVKGAPRSTQAWLADIDHLIVGVQTPFTTATQSISAQAIHNGNASATFESLKPADATVSVEAFSATESIGLATASTTIEPLKIKELDVSLTLANNYDYRGNVSLGITLNDGPVIVVNPTPILPEVLTFSGGVKGYLDGTGADAKFDYIGGIAADAAGNLYVPDADYGLSKPYVRKITSGGVVTTFLSQDGAGFHDNTLWFPMGVAVDGSNNLFVASTGTPKISKVTPAGVVTTVLSGWDGASSCYYGGTGYFLACDPNGNLYVSDCYRHQILKVTPAGAVSRFAGFADGSGGQFGSADGAVADARFNNPAGLAFAANGDLYVADRGNHKIRKISNGVVSTFAGTGTAGSQNGQAASATFNLPFGLTIDPSGNLYVAERGSNLIRKITPAGVVSTVAGNGTPGFQDGTTAMFDGPAGIVYADGCLYVTDANNYRVRKITGI